MSRRVVKERLNRFKKALYHNSKDHEAIAHGFETMRGTVSFADAVLKHDIIKNADIEFFFRLFNDSDEHRALIHRKIFEGNLTNIMHAIAIPSDNKDKLGAWNAALDYCSHYPDKLYEILLHKKGPYNRTPLTYLPLEPGYIEPLAKIYADQPDKLEKILCDYIDIPYAVLSDRKEWKFLDPLRKHFGGKEMLMRKLLLDSHIDESLITFRKDDLDGFQTIMELISNDPGLTTDCLLRKSRRIKEPVIAEIFTSPEGLSAMKRLCDYYHEHDLPLEELLNKKVTDRYGTRSKTAYGLAYLIAAMCDDKEKLKSGIEFLNYLSNTFTPKDIKPCVHVQGEKTNENVFDDAQDIRTVRRDPKDDIYNYHRGYITSPATIEAFTASYLLFAKQGIRLQKNWVSQDTPGHYFNNCLAQTTLADFLNRMPELNKPEHLIDFAILTQKIMLLVGNLGIDHTAHPECSAAVQEGLFLNGGSSLEQIHKRAEALKDIPEGNLISVKDMVGELATTIAKPAIIAKTGRATDPAFLSITVPHHHKELTSTANALSAKVFLGHVSIEQALALSDQWHKPHTGISEDLRPYFKNNFVWKPLFQNFTASNGVTITCLTSNDDLRYETEILKHCVGDKNTKYGFECAAGGESKGLKHIISFRRKNLPIYTIELALEKLATPPQTHFAAPPDTDFVLVEKQGEAKTVNNIKTFEKEKDVVDAIEEFQAAVKKKKISFAIDSFDERTHKLGGKGASEAAVHDVAGYTHSIPPIIKEIGFMPTPENVDLILEDRAKHLRIKPAGTKITEVPVKKRKEFSYSGFGSGKKYTDIFISPEEKTRPILSIAYGEGVISDKFNDQFPHKPKTGGAIQLIEQRGGNLMKAIEDVWGSDYLFVKELKKKEALKRSNDTLSR